MSKVKQEELINLLNDLIGATMALTLFKARSCLKCEKKEYKKLLHNVTLAREKICKKVLDTGIRGKCVHFCHIDDRW